MIRPIIYCSNSECGRSITNYKSAKRKFCCDQCRNRYGFLTRKINHKEMDLYVKNLKDFEKLLSHLLKYNIDRISREDIAKSSFRNLKLPSLESKLIGENYETGIALGNIFLKALKLVDQKCYFFCKIK